MRAIVADDPTFMSGFDDPAVLPLRSAACHGRAGVVYFLRARGTEPTMAAWGETRLDFARERGHDEVVALLVVTEAAG